MASEENNNSNELQELLATSNQQLLEMQDEHRRLLAEMERLRQRATELSLLNETQFQSRSGLGNHESDSYQNNRFDKPMVAPETVAFSSTSEMAKEQQPCENIEETAQESDSDKKYIQEKLSQIAALKDQYQRVQNAINTTNLIEQHLASKDNAEDNFKNDIKHTEKEVTVRDASSVSKSEFISNCTATGTNASIIENSGFSTTPTSSNQQPANEELLTDMYKTFTEFSNNLRHEAESLRVERERIRALKEDILRRHMEKP